MFSTYQLFVSSLAKLVSTINFERSDLMSMATYRH